MNVDKEYELYLCVETCFCIDKKGSLLLCECRRKTKRDLDATVYNLLLSTVLTLQKEKKQQKVRGALFIFLCLR